MAILPFPDIPRPVLFGFKNGAASLPKVNPAFLQEKVLSITGFADTSGNTGGLEKEADSLPEGVPRCSGRAAQGSSE